MRNTNQLGELLKARREGLGLTRRLLAKQLGIEASYITFMESGRRRPSLKLIAKIADTLGLDRQQLLILAHPEAKALIAKPNSERPTNTAPSWQWFINKQKLLARYHVTARELQALEHLSLLGTVRSAKELLAILTLIRDIPAIK
jgi:transcriptional regulator with XRE-family HTH domain